MNRALLFDRTEGYLRSQARDPSAFHLPRAAAPFITISREAGSGGSSLARLLARRLNAEAPADVFWRVYDGSVTTRMLDANRVSRTVARYLPEDRVPEVTSTIGELVGLHPNLWTLVQKTNEAIHQFAAAGHAIIVGRGANFATADLPHGLHVRLIAPEADRAEFLAAQYNVPTRHAALLNAKCEAGRRRYVRANFNADVADPYAYDLIINTGRVSLTDAAEMICTRIAQLQNTRH